MRDREESSSNQELETGQIAETQQKETSGIKSTTRFAYNVSPSTKQLSHSSAIPNFVHYTPFHPEVEPEVYINSKGLICNKCKSYYNKYCTVIEKKKLWVCCICQEGNSLEKKVEGRIKEEETYQMSLESQPQLNMKRQKCYLFLIDLCISEKQMRAIRQSLVQFVKRKASQAYEGVDLTNKIGIITYSKYVHCYQLASKLNTVICISGEQVYEQENIYSFLSMNPEGEERQAEKKYFVNVKSEEYKILKRIRKIRGQGNIQFENQPGRRCRAKRAYGQALTIALTICQKIKSDCRIVSFIGGPCTFGVGTTIGVSFKHQMRSIKQFQNSENVHYYQNSSKFYRGLIAKAQGRRTVIDSFIFSLEQTGLAQTYSLIRSTGGVVVLGQQFSNQLQIFSKSFAKVYLDSNENQMPLSLVSSCKVTITCSSELRINGAVSPCKPLTTKKDSEYVSDKVIGFGQTNQWFIGGMSCYRTLTFIYQVIGTQASDSHYFIQFRTDYKDYWGFWKTRITTVRRQLSSDTSKIAQNFDQQAAVVGIARWYLYKQNYEPKINLIQWVDKLLVKWTASYANFIRNDHESFNLPIKMKFLPQFIYFFRRNPIIRRSGLSLDELIFQTHILNTQTIEHCISIIQPALLSYSLQKPQPSPVQLDQSQMKSEVILLLDTFFNVIIWYGESIDYWEREEYHLKKEYEHVKNLLQAPKQDLQFLLQSRFPYPGFYRTTIGHSKERFLKSKISPLGSLEQSQNTLSDDKSLHNFMKVLVDIIVTGKVSL